MPIRRRGVWFTLAQADSDIYKTIKSTFYLDEGLLESVRADRILGNAWNVEIRVGEVAAGLDFAGNVGLLRQLLRRREIHSRRGTSIHR